MKGEILGVERRRRWSDGEKLAILAAVGVNGATVTEVARRHEITRSQVYGWRRDLKRKRLLPAAAPVCFVSLTPGSPDPDTREDLSGPKGIVEIVLRGGRLLRVPSDLDGVALARLIRVTEAA
jgi:transposase